METFSGAAEVMLNAQQALLHAANRPANVTEVIVNALKSGVDDIAAALKAKTVENFHLVDAAIGKAKAWPSGTGGKPEKTIAAGWAALMGLKFRADIANEAGKACLLYTSPSPRD
eukprot:11452718-Alexandrium_andersonii.AAC.1